MLYPQEFDVIVVGGGHAGTGAAVAAAGRGSKTLLPLGEGDMDYSAIRAFLANRAPAAPLLRDEVILPADTADVRYLRRMTDTV